MAVRIHVVAASKPEVDIYVRCYEDIPIEQLWEKHVDGIQRFRAYQDTVPVDHRTLNNPAVFLAMMDNLFSRFLGIR